MIAKSWFSRCWQWQIGGCVAIFGALSVGVSDRVNAQIVPDNTLGAEGSVVTPNVNIQGIPSDRIDGGATRGANLFHSFQEFNVEEGRGAYFANPTGIENILTRVTGGNASNILGRLGVLGGANLFLLNPNGIVFGPNASLDIQGSFVATTAERIQLGDSGYFSAAQPQTSSLLSVSPGALFFSQVANQPGSIINRGNLLTGKHLTLAAGNLDLQGQLLTGGDLTLQAQDTVKVRDSAAMPFIASAGGNLLVQGNQGIDIAALSHPYSGLLAGGNLVLRSDRTVGGDARFWSGGNFSTERLDGSLGNLYSPHDPIFLVNGDVTLGDYEGASLHILAGGSVTLGNVTITGTGDAATTINPTNTALFNGSRTYADLATVYLTDYKATVNSDGSVRSVDPVLVPITIDGSTRATLDVRAGVDWAALGGLPTNRFLPGTPPPPPVSQMATSANITVNGNIRVTQPAGLVLLTNQFSPNTLPGTISIRGDVDTSTRNTGANGGDIRVYGRGDIEVVGNAPNRILIDSSSDSDSDAGQGGAIGLTAANDIHITGDLYSSSSSFRGNAGQGGAIGLTAANDIHITYGLYSYSLSRLGNAGQGGTIGLTAANDIHITGNLSSYSKSETGTAGQGGAIGLTAANDIHITGNLYSPSNSSLGNAGQGGAIGLTAANNIYITADLSSYSFSTLGNAGQGGAIGLTAANDIHITGNLSSYSQSYSDNASPGNAGQGGAIGLTAANDIHITGNLTSYSYSDSGKAGQGGAIGLTAANDIHITGDLYSFSYSESGTAGQGGAISLIARSGDIVGILFKSYRDTEVRSPVLGSFSISEQGTAGNGGNVALEAKNKVSNLEILTLSSDSQSGTVQVTGLGDLSLTNTNILTSKQVTVPTPFGSRGFITLNVGGKGQSGFVDVTSLGNLTFNNSSIQSDTKGSDSAGNVTVNSPGLVTFNNSSIRSNTSSKGAAGRIDIDAGQGITLVGSDSELFALFAGTTNQGKAGNITLTTSELTLQNRAKIATTTSSSSAAGAITLQSHPNGENLNINLAPETSISASTSSQGTGGNIEIKAPNAITIQEQGTITTSTTGTGNAGNITLDTSTLTIARGAQLFALTEGSGNSGTIEVNASTAVNLGIGVDDFSPVLSVETSNAGQAGSIIINTPSLTLSDTARITATATNTATNTEGGGSITLNASTMDLAGVVGVFAETEGQSPAGTLTLQPYQNQSTLNLTLAPQSEVSASTSGSGQGGNLIVTAPEAVTIRGPGLLAVETTGDGAAGNLTIDTQRLTIADGAKVSASTSSTNPNGIGGNITVNATQSFDLSNGASLRAQSTGAAPAGKVTINTPNLTATNGAIATSSNQSSGGDITITADKIRLYRDSDITTFVAQGAGGGGDIKLTADSIVAFDDSDILAFAPGGTGGNITLETPAFFGENYRPAPRNTVPSSLDGNNRVDVNATGAVNGVITRPDTTFIQNSLTELPENQIDTDSLLANSCIVRRNQPTRGSFTITGTGGLPQRPGDAQMSSFPTVDIETLPSDDTSSTTNPRRPWQKGDPIVEPQGVYRLPNGKLVLSRECSGIQ